MGKASVGINHSLFQQYSLEVLGNRAESLQAARVTLRKEGA